jgi:hypothetical protein
MMARNPGEPTLRLTRFQTASGLALVIALSSLTAARTQTPASLLERLDADIRPSRMKCVTLPLSVLQEALSGQEVTR